MKSKTTTNSQLSTNEPKKLKLKLSKQLEQKQNHRNGNHMEDYQWGAGRRECGEKSQETRSTICRHKIDRERLRMIKEIEKLKNLYVQPTDMN